MLKAANNDLITDTTGILTTPVVADANLKFCKRLSGKEICCDSTAQDNLVNAFKAKYQKFNSQREKMSKDIDKSIKSAEDNEDRDAEVGAKVEEVIISNDEGRILIEEDIVALKNLRFL